MPNDLASCTAGFFSVRTFSDPIANMAANGDLPALHTSPEEFLQHDYDFIIAGGGTAGLVVAARLTENEDVSGE